jgi:hypothetical protein
MIDFEGQFVLFEKLNLIETLILSPFMFICKIDVFDLVNYNKYFPKCLKGHF